MKYVKLLFVTGYNNVVQIKTHGAVHKGRPQRRWMVSVKINADTCGQGRG